MALWMVRAGRDGEQENFALDNGQVVIGWNLLGDLSEITSREDLRNAYRRAYPDHERNRVANEVGQLWTFKERIQIGDLVVLPLQSRHAIAIARVTQPYVYRPENPEHAHHSRLVEWLRTDIPRTAFDQDLLYSFGAFMTVCQIQRNNAEQRVRAFLNLSAPPAPRAATPVTVLEETQAEPIVPPNLEQYAQDQIAAYVGRRFRGHDLARLVGAVLKAQRYQTEVSPPGADGGVDIIAGTGPMAFGSPRICVQVKSSDQPLGVTPLRELQGVMDNFRAERGLLVSWGGFNRTVLAESSRLFFTIRLWDAGDMVEAMLENYEQLPDDVQAELPLKRIWTLVPEG